MILAQTLIDAQRHLYRRETLELCCEATAITAMVISAILIIFVAAGLTSVGITIAGVRSWGI